MRRPHAIRLSVIGLVMGTLLLVATSARASTVVACTFSGSPQDHADSGIVVASYPGDNVRRLHIGYGADATGQYLITAQLRRGGFDGPIIGSSSIYLDLDATSSTDVDGFFHFGGPND